MNIDDLLPTAILVPSLDRPQRLRSLVANIHENTPEEHFILFAVSDPESKAILDDLGEYYLDDSADEDRRYVTRMNKLLAYLDDAKTLFFGSDDVLHHPRWLQHALLTIAQTDKSCVVVNDMFNSAGTQAVIRRGYLEHAVFDAPGLAFHPGYHHNFADNEMFWTANIRGDHARSFDSCVEHLHPIYRQPGGAEWDSTYENATKGWEHDQALWLSRWALIQAALG